MANVLLTEECVRSCPYCFARSHTLAKKQSSLDFDNLIYIADFLEAGGEKAVSLLGGETFLHPECVDFAMYLVERRFHVNIFTSGILSRDQMEAACEFLKPADPERLSFVVNYNSPDITSAAHTKAIDAFLKEFYLHISLGVNIYTVDFDLGYVFDAVLRYGLKRHVRIGLAHPIVGEKNEYLRPDQVKAAMKRLAKYFPEFDRLGVTPGFDCGFPLCALSDRELATFFRLTGGQTRFSCGPALDIGPDLSVWSCFPLSQYKRRSLFEFDSLPALRAFYEQVHDSVRTESGGIFLDCDTCVHRTRKYCAGGCLAHFLKEDYGAMQAEAAENAHE